MAGIYTLRIESRLEDLSGNNLNRPFDRDVTRKNTSVTANELFEQSFRLTTAGDTGRIP